MNIFKLNYVVTQVKYFCIDNNTIPTTMFKMVGKLILFKKNTEKSVLTYFKWPVHSFIVKAVIWEFCTLLIILEFFFSSKMYRDIQSVQMQF